MKRLNQDQTGLAAIIVSVFIMLVLTLVVLAFSQITRREQRQGLDRQLVTQAFYAAESGINDATKYIRTHPANPANLATTSCDQFPTLLGGGTSSKLDGRADPSSSVFKYSCVLFDRHPQTLEYSGIKAAESGEVMSLKTETNDLSNLTITWNTAGGSKFNGCPTDPNAPFPTQVDYDPPAPLGCDAGVIRVLLMPFSSGADLNREKLIKSSYTVYLRPVKTGGGTAAFAAHEAGPDGQGSVVPAKCDSAAGSPAAGRCTVTINGVPGNGGLFMHIRSIYKDSVVSISGTNGSTPVRFTEAQAVIDSTGKANDVLKRLQVRIPLVEHYDLPAYVVETINGICKQLDVTPTSASATTACGGSNYFTNP